MFLLVGIDTEGDNQWDAAARANQRFENIYALPVLHALFRRHGVRPTYVITHPVATDGRSAETLRTLMRYYLASIPAIAILAGIGASKGWNDGGYARLASAILLAGSVVVGLRSWWAALG